MKRLLLSFAVVAGLSTSAGAQQINNAGDPALAGATLVNFNSATMGLFSSMTFGGLTISGIGGQLMMTNQWNGSYGATGIHFQNYTGTGTTQTVRFSFTGGTSAFGFSLGAADTRPSSLTAYDVNNNVLASYATPFNNVSTGYVDYTGIAAPGIAYADLTLQAYSQQSYDYVIIDDVSFQPATVVPEPASLALLGAGLLVLIPVVRRRARKA